MRLRRLFLQGALECTLVGGASDTRNRTYFWPSLVSLIFGLLQFHLFLVFFSFTMKHCRKVILIKYGLL
jgi:hypothetical protein